MSELNPLLRRDWLPDLEQRIALARHHVQEGRNIVRRQRARIAGGEAGPDAGSLLTTFEKSLAILEEDLERLLTERDVKWQLDIAQHITEWLSSPGMRPPK